MQFSEEDSMPAPIQQPASLALSSLPEVGENSSLESTSQSLFQEELPAAALDRRKLGALHLQPATVEELFDIDRFKYGEYDLVEGLLIWRGMSESNRNKEQAKHLLYRFQRAEQDKPTTRRVATLEATIAIPTKRYLMSHQPSSSNAPPQSEDSEKSPTPRRGHPDYSVVRADFAVGERISNEDRALLSPGSSKITFPLKRTPPEVVVENTSTNGRRDMVEKQELYAQRKIPKYITIHNDARAKNPQPAVHEGNLRNGKYEGMEKPLRGEDEVNLGPIGVLKAKDCIQPGSPDARVHREGREQRMKREEAEKKRVEEEQKRKQAEKKEREEKEKRKQAENKEREEKEKRKQAEKKEREEKEKRKQAENKEREEKEKRKQAEKKEREEKEKRVEEEQKRKQAEKKEREEKEKRKQAEAKVRKQRKLMRDAGLLVSDSSSSSRGGSNSPISSGPSSRDSPRDSSSSRSPRRKKRK
ncbi:Reticulocyte-binding protein 2-like [Gracilariopsis chorda]|uniref:Reticulocyte-binding protein 2-like n=1 Tax=Gracilariopsis chorda TaxID=448386 RepID=A0A2V3IKQ5_9FLOR|nr:Reticulocyte-binding protein 2-like [Gracilariopsis chorda]|eukprot:PXF42643.1 Reticulocyte-binding protein 2-like [Gracilariopsis chorda]